VTIEKWVRLGFDLVRGGARGRGQLSKLKLIVLMDEFNISPEIF
jgi:hypothetical protein